MKQLFIVNLQLMFHKLINDDNYSATGIIKNWMSINVTIQRLWFK